MESRSQNDPRAIVSLRHRHRPRRTSWSVVTANVEVLIFFWDNLLTVPTGILLRALQVCGQIGLRDEVTSADPRCNKSAFCNRLVNGTGADVQILANFGNREHTLKFWLRYRTE